METSVAISIINQVITYAPLVEHVITEFPDILAKGKDLLQKLSKFDLTDAVTDMEGIAADLGITQSALSDVVNHATANPPPK